MNNKWSTHWQAGFCVHHKMSKMFSCKYNQLCLMKQTWEEHRMWHYIGSVYTVIKWQQPTHQSIKEKEKITHCSTPNNFSFNKNLCIFQSALYLIFDYFIQYVLPKKHCLHLYLFACICSIASHLFLRSDCLRVLSKQDHFLLVLLLNNLQNTLKKQHKIITNEELYDRGS